MERDCQADRSNAPRNVQLLIVEDDYIFAITLKEVLELLGYAVGGIADSLSTVTEQIVQFRPDLVLMNIQLNGSLDGIGVARFLWNARRIPVIYLTGYSDQGILDRARTTVPAGYLVKPVSISDIDATIATALNRDRHNQKDSDHPT